jgi:hypothetical protein
MTQGSADLLFCLWSVSNTREALSFRFGQAQGFFEGRAGLFGPVPLQKRRGNNAKTNKSALP